MTEKAHKAKFTNVDDESGRRHDRISVETQVQYRVINRQVVDEISGRVGGFHDDGESVNISVSGIALATETLLNKGDYIKLEMKLPSSERATRALAEVMWIKKEQDKNISGIRFLIILNEADDHSVSQFIERVQDTED